MCEHRWIHDGTQMNLESIVKQTKPNTEGQILYNSFIRNIQNCLTPRDLDYWFLEAKGMDEE